MSSLKPKPYSLLNYPVDARIVSCRIKALKDVFLKVESIHADEYSNLYSLMESQDDEDLCLYYSDNIRVLDHEFYRIHRVSTILSLYSLLETMMVSICNQRKGESKFDLSDLNGSGIQRCKIYLEKLGLCDLSNPIFNPLWSKLSLLNKLRNSFAHAEGDLAKSDKLKIETVKATKGLYVEDSQVIMMEKEFVIDSIEVVESFLNELCKI